MSAVFVDAWAWIALASQDDQHHEAAAAEHGRLVKQRREYVTTDFVLGEVVTHIYRTQDVAEAEAFIGGLWDRLDRNEYRMVHLTPAQVRQAWQMRKKYRDKPDISFVDFTSFVVMRDLGISDVFTGDAHFEQVGMGFRLVP
jgi:predicted nucleic acid-binding protein